MNIGSFAVKERLSEGSFGRTFIGEHLVLKTPVCIKQEKTGEPEFQRLFKEEAKCLWGLTHHAIPVIRDYIEHPDPAIGHIMILSFVKGNTIEKTLQKGFVDDEHICWILDRIFEGVSYLHYKGIIHSDIKPANIILNIPEHSATIIDFGMASMSPDDRSKAKGGTPGFLPPEFELGKPPIPASDIYSIGMLAVSISGGNIKNGELPKDMKPELAEFIEKMIRADPLSRPQDVSSLRIELAGLRKKMFRRKSCNDMFKFRK